MKYEIQESKVYDLPEYVSCTAYGGEEIFKLSPERELNVGPRPDYKEGPFIYKLAENEVLYKSRWGWGLFVDIHTMIVISPKGLEWYGKTVVPIIDNNLVDENEFEF